MAFERPVVPGLQMNGNDGNDEGNFLHTRAEEDLCCLLRVPSVESFGQETAFVGHEVIQCPPTLLEKFLRCFSSSRHDDDPLLRICLRESSEREAADSGLHPQWVHSDVRRVTDFEGMR